MKIGRTTRLITDRSRSHPFMNNGGKRLFMISLYYPSNDQSFIDNEPVYTELFHPGEEVAIQFFEKFGADTAHLSKLKTNVYQNAGISKKECYPVIVCSPAFGIERDMYWFFISNLVMNGFIVLTVGATYDSVFTVFPDGENIEQLKTLADLEGTDFEGWSSLLEIRKQDICHILDQLTEINAADQLFKNKLDLQRVGLIGHSLGGAAVYKMLNQYPTIKAGVLLDSSLHLFGPETIPIQTPVLLMRQHSSSYAMLLSDGWNEKLARETINGQMHLTEVLKGYKSFIRIDGANHVIFSDAPIHFNEPEIEVKHRLISSIIASFFNEFIYGRSGEYTSKIDEFTGLSVIGCDGEVVTQDRSSR